MRHVAFALSAAGLEEARSLLTDREISFRAEDHGSALSLYLSDPDENVIELTTYER